MINTETTLNENEWKDTGKRRKLPFEIVDGKKVWFKFCECGSKQIYHSKTAISYALKHNKRCLSCKNKGENNPFFHKFHTDDHKKVLSEKQLTNGSYRYKNKGGNPPKLKKNCKLCSKEFFVTKCQEQRKYCCYKCALRDNFGFEIGRKTTPELIYESILVEKKIEYKYGYELGGKIYDFYIPSQNLLVEIDGIYWHGKGVLDDELDHIQRKIRKNDLIKNRLAEENGYNLIRIWEDEIKNVPEHLYRQEGKCLLPVG